MRIVAAFVLLLVGLSILSGSSDASNVPDVDPDPRLTQELEAARRAAALPGMAVAVFRRGDVVYSRGFGEADVASGTPVTVHTSFHVGTMGSVLTAVAALVLAEDGALDLDRDVNAFLDLGFPVEHPQHRERAITVRMLLTHGSAMLDNFESGQAYLFAPPGTEGSLYVPGDSEVGLRELLVRRLSRSGDLYVPGGTWGPLSAPGEAYRHSSFGIGLAAYVLGRASAMTNGPRSFEQLLKRRIFDPLAMADTAFHLADLPTAPATPYEVWGDGVPHPFAYPQWSEPNFPAAGLRTSVSDFTRLVVALATDGSYRNHAIIEPNSIGAMRREAPHHHPSDLAQGLVLRARDFDGRRMFGAEGHAPGAEAYFYFDPRDASGFVFMTNAEVGRRAGGMVPESARAAMRTIEQQLLLASVAP